MNLAASRSGAAASPSSTASASAIRGTRAGLTKLATSWRRETGGHAALDESRPSARWTGSRGRSAARRARRPRRSARRSRCPPGSGRARRSGHTATMPLAGPRAQRGSGRCRRLTPSGTAFQNTTLRRTRSGRGGMTRQVDDLGSDYAAAGFGGTLGWGDSPAVVVIDVCQAYLDPASPLYAGVEAARDAMGELVARRTRGRCARRLDARRVRARRCRRRRVLPQGLEPRGVRAGRDVVRRLPAGDLSARRRGRLHQAVPLGLLRHLPGRRPPPSRASTRWCSAASRPRAACAPPAWTPCPTDSSPWSSPKRAATARRDRTTRPIFDMGAKYAEVVPLADAVAHVDTLS